MNARNVLIGNSLAREDSRKNRIRMPLSHCLLFPHKAVFYFKLNSGYLASFWIAAGFLDRFCLVLRNFICKYINLCLDCLLPVLTLQSFFFRWRLPTPCCDSCVSQLFSLKYVLSLYKAEAASSSTSAPPSIPARGSTEHSHSLKGWRWIIKKYALYIHLSISIFPLYIIYCY